MRREAGAIKFVPLRKLKLPSKIRAIAESLEDFAFFKGRVAREALLSHFSRFDRDFRGVLDYDFILFVSNPEVVYTNDYQDSFSTSITGLTDEEDEAHYRLSQLGDLEVGFSRREYFRTRDNSLNQVLLGNRGLFYTAAARNDACDFQVGMTSDVRPRTVLRNVLFSIRLRRDIPKAGIKEALKKASLIDQITPLLKAYHVGVEYEYWRVLASHSGRVRKDADVDLYLRRLLGEWMRVNKRPFNPRDPENERIIRQVLLRTREY